MTTRTFAACMAVIGLLSVVGCARAARDTTGFAMTDSAVVSAPLEEAWTATREVLQERKLDIQTRDKRGRFVAYTNMNRRLLVPHRDEYTITLTEESAGSTRVTIQTLRQVYGVTLMTYPGWHDRKTSDASESTAILEGIQQYVAGGDPAAEPATEPAAEPAAVPEEAAAPAEGKA